MSRKGNKPILLPNGTTIVCGNNIVTVNGSLGNLSFSIPSDLLNINISNNIVNVVRKNEDKRTKVLHGTIASLLSNAIIGVSKGYTKTLNIVGVGYKAAVKGKQIEVYAGFSGAGARYLDIPANLRVTCPTPTQIIISGNDKQVVGQFAALVRNIRRPEPYNGKGIAYSDEIIVRKVGKTAEGSKK